MTSPLPLLPTTVIGSYSMPEWLERAKNDYLSRRLSRHDLDEMHDAVRKAAIKDQEVAGVDIVSDGEPQRDNMIDYFAERHARRAGRSGLEALLLRLLRERRRGRSWPTGSLGLVRGGAVPRPVHRPRGEDLDLGPAHAGQADPEQALPDRGGVRARSRARAELRAARSWCAPAPRELQIDEPYYSGFPEDLPWALKAINAMVDGVNAHVTLHICYGNRYGKPSFEGSYRYPVPGDPRRQGPGRSRSSSRAAARRTCSCSRSSTCRSSSARRHRRQDARRRVAGVRRRPHPPRARSGSGRAAGHQSRLRAACACRATWRSAS